MAGKHRAPRPVRHYPTRIGAAVLLAAAVAGTSSFSFDRVALVGAPAMPSRGAVRVDGVQRSYQIFLPKTVSRHQAVPLVLVLHSLGHTAEDAATDSNFDAVATEHRLAVVYPQAIDKAWNAGECCSLNADGGPNATDDVAYLQAVIDSVRREVRVDPQRIYLTGFSNGAMMAMRFACEHPSEIAAVAALAGTLESSCPARQPINMLLIRGALDDTVPYDGTAYSNDVKAPLRSVPDTLGTFATLDGCLSTPLVSELPTAEYETYAGCAESSTVELISIKDLGHVWPTVSNSGFDADSAIWTFFSAHTA